MIDSSFFMADFETTTDENDCRVWAWGVCNILTEETHIGTRIDDFLEWCFRESCVLYFHNLIFDSAFIIDYIMKNGYEYTPENTPQNKQFTVVISAMGKMYGMKMCRRGVTVELRDSLKKIPLSVANTAKAFNLPISKLEIDYHEYRAPDHELTPHEELYLCHDILIMARALRHQLEEGLEKLTVGADALDYFKTSLGGAFTNLFPVLDPETDALIRKSYRGGFTYADPRYQGRKLGVGQVFDVNSLYPYVMKTRLLPVGMPVYHDGYQETSDEFPLAIYCMNFTAKLKSNHIPCIQIKNNPAFMPTAYLDNVDEVTQLWVTSVDWELWNDHYDIEEYGCAATFLCRAEYDIFTEYVDYWGHIKETSTGGMRTIAKLMLNSLYGKFATNPDVSGKYPVLENDCVKLVAGPEETRNPVHIPMGAFITAYAREITIRAAQENFDIFAYADTDSLHLITDTIPDNLDVHPTRLGAWKHEDSFTEALFIRAKQYLEKIDGHFSVHIAGMPKHVAKTLTFDTACDGATFGGKLVPVRVPGGMILRGTTFTIKYPSLENHYGTQV